MSSNSLIDSSDQSKDLNIFVTEVDRTTMNIRASPMMILSMIFAIRFSG